MIRKYSRLCPRSHLLAFFSRTATHAVGRLCGGAQAVQVVRVAAGDLRPRPGERLGARIRMAEPGHVMACVDEFRNEKGTDKPVAPVRNARNLHLLCGQAFGCGAHAGRCAAALIATPSRLHGLFRNLK
jgi:hypothetical protein